MKYRKRNAALSERSLAVSECRLALKVVTLPILGLLSCMLTPPSLFGRPLQATTPQPARASSQAGSSGSGALLTQPETRPLHDRQIVGLVAGGVNSGRVALLVDKRGIDFTPTVQFLRELLDAGADGVLIQSIIKARQTVTTLPTCPIGSLVWRVPAAADPASGVGSGTSGDPTSGDSPLPPESQAALRQDLDRASDLAQQHSWREAEDAYRHALKLDGQSASAHVGLANVLTGEERWDDAVAEYRQALKLDPSNPQAHRGLGDALAARHDPEGSITEYREAIRLNPNDAELQSKLGDALFANGDLDSAISAYRAALALKPGDSEVANKLGLALYVAGDMDGAIAAYREAIRLNPKDAEAHNNLGDVLLHQGDRRAALEEYHRAFELAPNGSTLGTSYAALLKQLSSP